MGDEQLEDVLLSEEDSPAPRRGRLRVALIAVAVLAVIGVAATLSAGRPQAPVPTGDASVALDEALTQGEPVYVLIHSLT